MKFDADLLRRCWFLAGPTASGKSAAGVELAERIGAEIVALDSMSLYQGMDIGTAKPEAALRARVPHHLLDLIGPSEEYSLAEYVQAAETTCRGIVSRGKTPLFVGGTGLYLRAILRGVFEGPSADWELRERLQSEANEHGDESLHARLQVVDPVLAAKLHPRDTRRVIRALEVFELTGRPHSEQQQQTPLPESERPRHVYWLSPDRAWLSSRIDRRVTEMFDAGLVDEVRRLRAGSALSRTARQALGYAEVLAHLAGETSLDATIVLVQQHTRQFAKRQHTWFRHLVECHAVPIAGMESPADIASLIHRQETLKATDQQTN